MGRQAPATHVRSPFALCDFVLQLGGFLCTPRARFPVIVYLNIGIQISGISLFALSGLLHIFLTKDPFEEKFESAQLFVSMIHINIKHLNIFINRKQFLSFMAKLEDLWEQAKKNEENIPILNKSSKRLYTIIPMFEMFLIMLPPFAAVTSLIKNVMLRNPDDPLTLTLKIWNPFDPEKHFWWATAYVNYTFLTAVMSTSTSICFLTIACELVSVQIKLLEFDLSQISASRRITNDSYILHQNILGLVREINRLLSSVLALEMFISSLQVAARGYTCIEALLKGDLIFFNNLYMLGVCTFAPFTVCANGNVISSQGDSLYKSAYHNRWYEESKSDKRSLLLLQTMSSKPVTLNYRHLLTLGMTQFTSLLQATYSYLTMITSIYL